MNFLSQLSTDSLLGTTIKQSADFQSTNVDLDALKYLFSANIAVSNEI